MTSVISLLFSIGIALLPFDAVYWPKELGTLAASPGLFFIFAAILMAPLAPAKEMPIFRQLKLATLLGVPMVGSVVSLAVFGWDMLYASKFFSLGVLSMIWLSPLLLADYFNIHHVRSAVLAGIIICLIGYVFSDLLGSLPSAVSSLVFDSEFANLGHDRPRGFTEEPSHFSGIFSRLIIIYFLIYESNKRYNPRRLIVFLCALAVFLVALGSKGAVAGAAIAVLSFTVSRKQLLYLILALPGAFWLVSTQLDHVTNDIEQFTSIATRTTLLLTGLISAFLNPLGWGYYGLYGAIQLIGGWSIEWVGDLFPGLILSEAQNIVGELNNVSTKSTPLDFVITFGWAFIWLMVKVVRIIRFADPRVRSCWVYVIVTSFSTSGHLSILTFLTFTVMLRLYPRFGESFSSSQALPTNAVA